MVCLHRGLGNNPAVIKWRDLNYQLYYTCNRHADREPYTEGDIRGTKNNALPIKDRFKSTGVAAGTANLPILLRMPPANATKQINQDMERSNVTDQLSVLSFSGSFENPGAKRCAIQGASRTTEDADSNQDQTQSAGYLINQPLDR